MLDTIDKKITFLIPSMNAGGAEKVALLLINELCKRGWNASVLMPHIGGAYDNKLDKRVQIIKLKYQNISKNIFEIARYLKKNKPAYFYSSMTYVNVIACIAVTISAYKGKFIISEHSNMSLRNANNKSFINNVITFLAKRIYKKATAIICVSESVKEDLKKLMPDLKKVKVIYNPVENLYIKTNYDNEKFKIISMGRIDKEKNFSLLIRSFSIVVNKCSTFKKNIELYILGDGTEKKNLEKLIHELKLDNKIFLLGFVSEPAALLSSADLFAFSSNREGFGNVLVEALSCGLPVVSTNCLSGPSEILQNGKFGKLVPVNDVEKLANAIIEILYDENCFSEEEKTKRKRRAQDFSVESIVNQYEMLFKEL